MLAWSHTPAQSAIKRLSHLPADAPTPELAQYVKTLMEARLHPQHYLPILSSLDSLSAALRPYQSLDSLGLDKFTADLHTLAEAVDILSQPYDGARINAVAEDIDNLSFYTQAQRENQALEMISKSVKQYYGITTNLQELLSDMIDGREHYLGARPMSKKPRSSLK